LDFVSFLRACSFIVSDMSASLDLEKISGTN